MSAGVHVGKLRHIVGEFVYDDSEQLVDLISHVKEIDEVERVLCPKRFLCLPEKNISVLKS
jgi:hypothetical protein